MNKAASENPDRKRHRWERATIDHLVDRVFDPNSREKHPRPSTTESDQERNLGRGASPQGMGPQKRPGSPDLLTGPEPSAAVNRSISGSCTGTTCRNPDGGSVCDGCEMASQPAASASKPNQTRSCCFSVLRPSDISGARAFGLARIGQAVTDQSVRVPTRREVGRRPMGGIEK